MDITLSNTILYMREFQKNNNIKKQCVTNAQYLYDCIRMSMSDTNVKVKSVLVFSNDLELQRSVIVGAHLVVILDNDNIIDPSYDIYCLQNVSYFDNIKDLMDIFDDKSKEMIKKNLDIKKLINGHLRFIKFADQINNGKCLVSGKKYYNDQADYIENIFKR
jgi:hypothetical protein